MKGSSFFSAGDVFGDYVIVKQLGKGGMGAVFLAKLASSGDLYAIKVMVPPEGPQRHEWRRRFVREAEFAMRIRHKNLVSVYDVGEDPETNYCYIIMEYLPGGSLTDRIKAQGRLDIRAAIDVTINVASALDAAHKAGVVHRDVKPDNIMFGSDGSPKLTDLGIAKFSGFDDETSVTKTGVILGTPAYMSPEQILNSHDVDARADIYSLGVVLYEMLTGRRPNATSTIMQLLAKAVKGEELPDVRTVRPEVSVAVSYVLSKMVAAKPEARPASAVEVARLLYDATTGRLVVKPAKKSSQKDGSFRGDGLAASDRKESASSGRAVKWIAAAAGAVALCTAVFFGVRVPNASKTDGRMPTAVTDTAEKVVREGPAVAANTTVREMAHEAATEEDAMDWFNDASGNVYSAKHGNYTWKYRLNSKGDAVLTSGSGAPCISPRPIGKVVVPERLGGHKVVAVGEKAFIDCDNLTEIVLPEGLKGIVGWHSFTRCGKLKTVNLPRSLRYLGGWSFEACKAITSFNFANCVKVNVRGGAVEEDFNLFGCAFTHSRSLQSMFASADNPKISSVDGVLYSKDKNALLAYPKARKVFSILPGVKKIVGCALSSCSLRNVKIPEGVEEVGSCAFEFNDGYLETVEFPKSLRKIGYVIFKETHSIKTVTFHGDAPKYVSGSLGWTKSDFVIEVERGSKGWNGPGSTDLPARWPVGAGGDSYRIRYIGETDAQVAARLSAKAPAQRRRLNEVHGKKEAVVLVPRLDHDPKAWAYSFELQDSWEKPGFNDSMWKRARGGFGHYVPHWNRWGQINTEWPTKKLFLRRRFNWPGGKITRIVSHAFHDDGIKMYLNGRLIFSDPYCRFDWLPVDIPVPHFAKALKQGENVLAVEATNDEHGGYFDCDLLVECNGETDRYVPRDGIRHIQTQDGVWTVRILNGLAQIGDGDNAALTPRPVGDLEIPREIGSLRIMAIARRAFIDCNGLASVKIPEGVRSVGREAFMKCRDLDRVEIPESLEYIGLLAFARTNIESIDIKNVRSIQGITFKFCPKLNEVRVNKDNPFYASHDGVLYDKSAKAVVFCPRNREQYMFPEGIRSIYECAFMQTKLASIVIPDTVEYVGHSAFSDCPNLREVVFKGDDCRIDSWAFGHNPKLKSVVLPRRLASLGDWSIFEGVPELEDVNIPDTIEMLSDATFRFCPKLRRLSFGKSLRAVRRLNFDHCTALEEVSFARVPEFYGDHIFGFCPNLKTVSFLSGDAPKVDPTFYKGSNPDLVTLVRRGSKGWNGPGSTDLPEKWPLDAGPNARKIRYIE